MINFNEATTTKKFLKLDFESFRFQTKRHANCERHDARL